MIEQYRKKPITIEAIIWDGYNTTEIQDFCGDTVTIEYYDAAWKANKAGVKADLTIKTLEGIHHANIGDYIIKGVKGEFYPCKPDVFEKTYEKVINNEPRDIPFTEDQWWRVVNNLHCTTHSLKYLEEFYPRISDKERENMVKAIEEFEQFSYKLYDKFGDQFHHRPDARSVCPNPDCHNIYAYFFEDWKYCPKCGTKLKFTYCDKEGK